MDDSMGQASKDRQGFYVGEPSVKLDLDKYGLSHLRGRDSRDWTDIEVDRLLDAFAKEDIAPELALPPSLEYIEALLARLHCRRCGGCCLVNPLNPVHPGVEVYEAELESISRYLDIPYKSLRRKTLAGRGLRNPLAPNEVVITRMLPLPCMFYDQKGKKCRVYDARPLVCRIYPVIFTDSDTSFTIKVNCEYGKDLCKSLLRGEARHLPSGR